MGVQDEAERFAPETLEEWTGWLATHHEDTSGVWLVTYTKASGKQAFDYDSAVCEALRFGWIDSKVRHVDDERIMQWYCPRKPRSFWSALNKERIERLEGDGRLEPAGRAVVETAKENGAWTALDDVDKAAMPDDLAAALDARPGARENWDGFTDSQRRDLLWWVLDAKRPETRERRITQTADKAAEGLRPR